MEDESDAALIARSIAEPVSFALLFDRHAAVLQRFLVRRVGADAADGLVGETFRIAFEARIRYDTSQPAALPWLYGIATHLIGKHRRAEGRRLRATATLASQRIPEGSGVERVGAELDARRLFARVAEAIAELPDGERDALLLYVWEELSYEAIAAALEIPVGTVRSRLNRARARLRELAGASGEERSTGPAKRRTIEP
jgi:RNA polymerase sigma-70 factor (ECF subfamily)